jgi:hypothetical protein
MDSYPDLKHFEILAKVDGNSTVKIRCQRLCVERTKYSALRTITRLVDRQERAHWKFQNLRNGYLHVEENQEPTADIHHLRS